MELVGRTVRKSFPGFGTFAGVVESYDAAAGYFRVLYEDGDSEEVDYGEISSMLAAMGEEVPAVGQHGTRRSNRGRRPKKRRRSEPDRAAGGGGDRDELVSVRVLGGEGASLMEKGELLVVNGVVSDEIFWENGGVRTVGETLMDGGCSDGDAGENVNAAAPGMEATPGKEEMMGAHGSDAADGTHMEDMDLMGLAKGIAYSEGGKDNLQEEPPSEIHDGGFSGNLRDDSTPSNEDDEGESRKRRRLSAKLKSPPDAPLRRSARRARAKVLSCEESAPARPENSPLVSENGMSWGKDYVLVPEDPKPELPPSSNDLDLEGLPVLDVFSVYTCLRSFSRLLFLSPFPLEAFVAALRCNFANSLIDSIHFSILQALEQHMEFLSQEGSQSAIECLRSLNWELLDPVTWPVYLAEYLLVHGSVMRPRIKLATLKLLSKEYYRQPAEVKLEILRCLCDDVIEVEAIRSELNTRMTVPELNVDSQHHMNTGRRRNDIAMNDVRSPSLDQDPLEETADGNIDECCLCGMDGSLICCDGCPLAFHSRCVGVVKDLLPEGDWYCPECLIQKGSELVKLSKQCRGAEVLGIDPHGRLYFSSYGYLLVSESCNAVASSCYYQKNDLSAVVKVLKSSHASYRAIVNAISSCWGIPVDAPSFNGLFGHEVMNMHEVMESNVDSKHSLPTKQDVGNEGITEDISKDKSAKPEQCDHVSVSLSNLVESNLVNSHQSAGMTCPSASACSELAEQMSHATTSVQMSQQTDADCSKDSSIPTDEFISLKPSDLAVEEERHNLFSGWNSTSLSTERKKNVVYQLQSDPCGYVNYYSFGRIASSVSEELIHKSSESNSKDPKKSAEDMMSGQLKAICKKSIKFCWYAYQKLSMEAQKERCGWCHSCKTPSDSDCLFKVTDDKNLEDSKPRAVGLRSEKNKKSHIISAIHHILSIEDRVRSLLSGPWENPHYSNLWRKAVMKASDVASLKHLLLLLESNLRRVALSAEWLKPVDFADTVGSASHIFTGTMQVSSNYPGARRQGKRSLPSAEHSAPVASSMCWWRGGRLSRQVFHWKMLPRSMASKGGRQAGCKKIPNILYPESSEFARRSKCVAWQAAVERSESISQLIFQVKELDLNIRWTELSNSQISQLTKESKKLTKLFKKVTIRRKCIEGTNVKYLLDFGKRETLPPVVTRYGVMLEESSNEKKKYWLSETHVPLDLLKRFEEKKVARLLKKKVPKLLPEKTSACKSKKRKRSEGLSYLIVKAQNLESRLCGHCRKEVLVRDSVNCQFCDGYFHRKHFRVPKGAITTTYTCYKCKDVKIEKVKADVHKDIKTEKVKAQVHKLVRKKKVVLKKKKSSTTMQLRSRTKKGKQVIVKSKKKSTGNKKGKKGQSKNGPSKKSQNGISCHKRKRSVVHHTYWLNGLLWTRKIEDDRGKEFRREKILLPLQQSENHSRQPECCLCLREYNPEVIYICCEVCGDWFHGDIYCLTLENINNLVGFKCHKCRRKSIPTCPFSPNAVVTEFQSFGKCTVRETSCVKDQNDEEMLQGGGCKDCSVITCKENCVDQEQKEVDNALTKEEAMMWTETRSVNGSDDVQLLGHEEEKVTSLLRENGVPTVAASQEKGALSNELTVVPELLVTSTLANSTESHSNNSISAKVG